MKTFGPNIAQPDEWEHVDAPIGRPCEYCEEPIKEGEPGFLMPLVEDIEPVLPLSVSYTATVTMREIVYHKECYLQQIFGHMAGMCRCNPESEKLTNRQRALQTEKHVYGLAGFNH